MSIIKIFIILSVIGFQIVTSSLFATDEEVLQILPIKIGLPEKFPKDILELKRDEVEKIVAFSNEFLELATHQEVQKIAELPVKYEVSPIPVSVQFYYNNKNLKQLENQNAIVSDLWWIKVSFVDSKKFDAEFFEELNQRNLPFEKVEEFREKYYRTPESSILIKFGHNTKTNQKTLTHIIIENAFGIDKLILSLDSNNKFLRISKYHISRFEDKIQVFSVHWNEDGNILEKNISPIYTNEEFQKEAAKGIFEILRNQ
ncbi:MAG: hypothetical protein LBJ67_17415 [Planctomycetaceae bacterium]|nr:hypothetical protein [Planctomycetaceae bacterium]